MDVVGIGTVKRFQDSICGCIVCCTKLIYKGINMDGQTVDIVFVCTVCFHHQKRRIVNPIVQNAFFIAAFLCRCIFFTEPRKNRNTVRCIAQTNCCTDFLTILGHCNRCRLYTIGEHCRIVKLRHLLIETRSETVILCSAVSAPEGHTFVDCRFCGFCRSR